MALGYPAFRDELRKRGFIDGRNLVIEFRSTRQDTSQLYADAAELAHSRGKRGLICAERNEAKGESCNPSYQPASHRRNSPSLLR
jgi:hypothetical protein